MKKTSTIRVLLAQLLVVMSGCSDPDPASVVEKAVAAQPAVTRSEQPTTAPADGEPPDPAVDDPPPTASVDGKIIIGGHGHSMVDTQSLRANLEVIEKAAFDGVIVNVNPDWQHQDPKLRRHRNWTWGGRPARTVEEYGHAIADLKDIAARTGRLRHNLMLYALRTARDFDKKAENIDWLEDDWSIVANNAFVAGVICREGNLDGIWFDLETSGGGPFNWLRWRKSTASYNRYAGIVRQRGREWMAAACRAKPDIVVMISHGYGDIHAFGGDSESLQTNNYGLMPPFLDGMLEGCTPRATVVHGGEATYSHMTYAALKHYVDVQRIQTSRLCTVPELAKKHFRYATALWPDFRSDRDGFDMSSFSRNHFTPDKLKHAFHNAMAASDKYVWTWDMQVHWWPTFNHAESRRSRDEYRRVFPDDYLQALSRSRESMELDWVPGRDDHEKYPPPTVDDSQLKPLLENYDVLANLKDGWQFALDPDDTDNWGVEFTNHEIFPGRWTPIGLGNWWENQGHPYNGLGWYRHTFAIPDASRDKRVYAVIGGVKDTADIHATEPGKRGKQVGKVSSRTPAVIDITDAIDLMADNVLSIRVSNPSGPGGLVGPVLIVAGKNSAGRHAYLAIRGNRDKPWGHWVKSPRFDDTRGFRFGDEFTVEARLRAPARGSYHARMWGSGTSASWDMVLTPGQVTLGNHTVKLRVQDWHDYRVIVRTTGDKIEQVLFIDGTQRARIVGDHLHRKSTDSQVGFGSPWVTIAQAPTAPRTDLDVDWFRCANRAITPSEKPSVFEAGPRKESFWDTTYDGDSLPQMVGWKYWPEGNPTSISQVVVPDPYLFDETGIAAIRAANKLVVADWTRGVIPRDLPLINSPGEQTAIKTLADGVMLTIPRSMDETFAWPGVTITQLAVTDWSPFRALAMILSNPTDQPIEIAVKVIDRDRDSWHHYFTIAPGKTKAIRIPTADLEQKINPAKIFAIGFNRRNVKSKQTFVFSDLYLFK